VSHWTKVTTKIKDSEALKKALHRMGLDFQEGDFSITQYGTTEKAEIRLDDAVGLSRQEDGTFSMVGDFYHSQNPKLSKYYGKTDQFSKDVDQAYAVEETILRMEEQQFFCAENPEAQVVNGKVRMVFERY
jgi:hypothetical protein